MATKTKNPRAKANTQKTAENPNRAAELFAAGQRVIAGEKPAAAPKQEQQELIGVPAMLADLLGDMIANGSRHDNLYRLVRVALDHQWRNLSFVAGRKEASLELDARDWADRHTQEWLDALAVARHIRRGEVGPDRAEETAKTVSERIRLTVKEDLRRRMENFVTDATPEDAWLMSQVLQDWDAHSSARPETPANESALAIGFEYALGSDRTYIRVPYRLADHIASYANALVNAAKLPEAS